MCSCALHQLRQLVFRCGRSSGCRGKEGCIYRQSGGMFELLALPRTSKCALQYCAQQFNAAVIPPRGVPAPVPRVP